MPSTVILGCGIHGLSAAYSLAQLLGDGRSITIIDIAQDACEGASGRPTAFLSNDSIQNPELNTLIQYSLALHVQLAKDHHGATKWQYEKVQSYNARPAGNDTSCERTRPEGFSWLACKSPWAESLWSGPTEYCSIDPHALGKFLLDQIQANGARALFGAQITKVTRHSGCDVSSVIVQTAHGHGKCEEEIPCDRLLIAAGPWTASLFKAMYPDSKIDVPILADTGSYSILLKLLPSHLFEPVWRNRSVTLRSGRMPSLQLMVRTDGLLHAATVPPATLSLEPLATEDRANRVGDNLCNLEANIQSMLSVPSEVVLRRACFSPVTKSGLPVISQVPSVCLGHGKQMSHSREGRNGVYILGGHGYWGIAASLGSGKLMAQLMLGEEPDVDIAKFDLGPQCSLLEQRQQASGSGTCSISLVTSALSSCWKARFPRRSGKRQDVCEKNQGYESV